MLSDEEKEIFNNLKEYMQSEINKGYHKFIYNDLDWDFKCIDCINAIDKVLKQSKEIEELKEDSCCMTNCVRRDKEKLFLEDKIKAKIEEIKLECENCPYQGEFCDELNSNNNCVPGMTILILLSLLEKE